MRGRSLRVCAKRGMEDKITMNAITEDSFLRVKVQRCVSFSEKGELGEYDLARDHDWVMVAKYRKGGNQNGWSRRNG